MIPIEISDCIADTCNNERINSICNYDIIHMNTLLYSRCV